METQGMPSTLKTLPRLADRRPGRFRQQPLVSALRASLFGVGLSLTCAPLHLAQAQQLIETEINYTLPAGPLAQSLNRFASEAGITLSFDPKLVQGKRAPSLNGHYSVEQGLNLLLAGSGILMTFMSDDVIALRASESDEDIATLGALSVTANSLSTNTEYSHTYASDLTSTATKLQMTPRNTPQIVNSVTHKVIEDFAMEDMEDILSVAPGVSVGHTDDDRRSYTARGYPMATQYNGMPSTSGI